MSRRQDQGPEPFPIFPPPRGLYKPYRVSNPLIGAGRAIQADHIRFTNNVLSTREGNESTVGTISPANIYGISTYGSSSKRDLLTVSNDDLYYTAMPTSPVFNAVGSFTGITGVSPATTPTERVSIVRFRNRFLIGIVNGGGLYWYDPDNRTMRAAGVPLPATAAAGAAGAAGLPSGTYALVYTNVNDQGHEGNPSAAVTGVVVVNQQISWSSIDVGPTGTAKRRLYRTVAGGSGEYFYLTEIADNVTTTFTDNVADASLGAKVDEDNTIPPLNIRAITTSRSRVYLLDDDGVTVYASKIDATTGLPNWEAYPTKLSLSIAFTGGEDKGKTLIFAAGDVYVGGGLKWARIVGDVATGVVVEEVLNEGIIGPYAWCQFPDNTFAFINQMKQLKHFKFGLDTEYLSADYQGVFDTLKLGYTASLMHGRSGPFLIHDIKHDAIEAHFATAASNNNKACVLDRKSGQWSESLTPYDVAHYSEFFGDLYGWSNTSGTGEVWSSAADPDTLRTFGPTQFGLLFGAKFEAVYEITGWSPSPGDDVEFVEIQLLVKAHKTREATTVAMSEDFYGSGFNVQFALDGAARWQKKRCYIPLEGIAATNAANRPVVRAITIGVHRTAKTLSLRITRTVEATSSPKVPLYPLEIAGIQVLANPLVSSRDDRKFRGGEGRVRADNGL